jgi:glycogen(starch) synthase
LHIPHAYWPVIGGAEHYCQRLSEELAARGHEVRVVTADAESPEVYYQFGVGRIGVAREMLNGVEVLRLPFGGRLYRLGTSVPASVRPRLLRTMRKRFTRLLEREIDSFRPDVVGALPHLFVNVRAVLELHRKQPLPLILVPLLHEHDPHWPVQELRTALSQAAAVIATTPSEAERLRTAYGVSQDRLFVTWMGADLPAHSFTSQPRPPRVLYLGRKALSKGLPLLLESMRTVWRRRPEVELVLAGSRVPMTAEVDRFLDALPAEERARIRSVDDVDEGTKADLLRTSACLVLPSKIESFGMVLLEAWAHGTPVVALNLPAIGDIVDHGRDGLLVQPDHPQEMAEAVLALLDDPARSSEMGMNGRQKVERLFSWDKVAERYLQACKRAAGSAPLQITGP